MLYFTHSNKIKWSADQEYEEYKLN
ncbi:hypothetical protein RA210_U560003 [Rubrivivax sp. A210]|nr:hypothetical protein RA210_U560003 [Rubrivivax sp. A210]